VKTKQNSQLSARKIPIAFSCVAFIVLVGCHREESNSAPPAGSVSNLTVVPGPVITNQMATNQTPDQINVNTPQPPTTTNLTVTNPPPSATGH
jgi:hypothetical protein